MTKQASDEREDSAPHRVDLRAWRGSLRPQLAALSVYDPPDLAPADPSIRARLHANESPFDWPDALRERFAEIARNLEYQRYPSATGRAVRELFAAEFQVEADRVVVGNGSDEVISLLLTALSGSAAPRLVIPTPTFVMYAHSAQVLGYAVTPVALDDDFQLRPDAMDEALGSATICFLARPNNPTSSLWDADVIEWLTRRHPDTIIVVDEAYGAYAPGTTMYRRDLPSNRVHMSTLSKVGLASLRLGYAVADSELALALHKVRHPYNISSYSLAVAQEILLHHRASLTDLATRGIRARERLEKLLMGIPGARVFPAHGNMVLARLAPDEEAVRLVTRLQSQGILIKNLHGTPQLEGCIRVSIGTDAELDALDAALEQLHRETSV